MEGRQEKQEAEGQRPNSRWCGWADLRVERRLSREEGGGLGSREEPGWAPLTPTKLKVWWVENEAWSRT